MRAQLARLALFASLFVLLCLVLFIVNQTAQVVSLANTVSPLFGKIVLFTLLSVYGVFVIVPLVIIARLQSAEFQTYLRRLGARLERNPHLAGKDVQLSDQTGIEAALKILDLRVDEIVKKTASAVFVSTAVSQNGRLDALMVLAAQTRMIW